MTKKRNKSAKLPTNVREVQRSGRSYYRADVRVGAKRLYGPLRDHADQAHADVRHIKERGRVAAKVKNFLTLEQAIELMLERAKARGFSKRLEKPCRPGTIRHYRECCALLWRHLGGETHLVDITPATIERFRVERRKQVFRRCQCHEDDAKRNTCQHNGYPVSSARINRDVKVLGLVFRAAIDAGKHPAGENPAEKVSLYAEPQEESAWFEPGEVAEILAVIRAKDTSSSAWFHDCVAFLFLSGRRVGALADLQRKHIDLQRGTFTLAQDKADIANRTLPMSQPLRIVFTRMVDGLRPNDYLVPHTARAGKKSTTTARAQKVKGAFQRWAKYLRPELGCRFHAHALRHSAESYLASLVGDAAIPEFHTRLLLGRSMRGMSDRYKHTNLLQLRRTVATAFDGLANDLLAELASDAAAGEARG